MTLSIFLPQILTNDFYFLEFYSFIVSPNNLYFSCFVSSFRAAWYLLDLYFLPSHKVLSLTLGQLIGATVLTVFRQDFWF